MMRGENNQAQSAVQVCRCHVGHGCDEDEGRNNDGGGGFLPEAEPDGGKADAGGQQGNGEADQKEIAQIISRKGSGKSVEQVR